MNAENKIGVIIIISFILLTLAMFYHGGIWEYGGCVIIHKAEDFLHNHDIYPQIKGSDPVYTWPYTPLSLLLFAYSYIIFHGSPLLMAIQSALMLIGAGIVAGRVASKIAGKDITLLTAGLFLLFIPATIYGTIPRVDNLAILFLSIAIYYFEKEDHTKTLLFALFAFLSKQSYVFTIPLLYLFSSNIKGSIRTALAYGAATALLIIDGGFFQNVIRYMVIESTVVPHNTAPEMIIAMTVRTINSGYIIPVLLGIFNRKKKYFFAGCVLFLISSVLIAKPGAAMLYMYPAILLFAISAGAGTVRIKHKKALIAVLLVVFVYNYQIIFYTDVLSPLKDLKNIGEHYTVFSDNACVDSGHYDWFVLNQFAIAGEWKWDKVASSITDGKYDYIVLFTNVYSPPVNQRMPKSVYSTILQYYKPYTTYTVIGRDVVVYTYDLPQNL